MYVDYHHNDLADDEASLKKTLSEAMHTSESDLAMNKAGKLSTPQMVRLSFHVLVPLAKLISAAAGLVTLAIALYVAGPTLLAHYRLMLSAGKYLVLGGGALFFGLIAFIMKLIFASGRTLQFLLDLMEGKVTSVSGRMNMSKNEEIEDGLNTFTKQKTETFSCVVKGEYFEVSEDGFEALHDRSGGNYKVYVTPRSRYMVAIEPAVTETGTRDPFKLEYKDRT
jgi:hypothetical protein